MPTKQENVTLYGEKADQFREVKAEMEEILGHEPSNAQAVGMLMAGWDPGEPLPRQPVHQ